MNRILLIVALLLTGNAMSEERPWVQTELEYEGFPLFLRYPFNLNYEELKFLYPKLITVTHILTKVKNNGLPESEYNESLFYFDEQVVDILENNNAGITVLVETFGGKRAYYMYAKSDFSLSFLEKKLEDSYPENEVEIESRTDEDWSFIKQYSNDWNF